MQKNLLDKLARNLKYLEKEDYISIYEETGFCLSSPDDFISEDDLVFTILYDFGEDNIIPTFNTVYFDGYYKCNDFVNKNELKKHSYNMYEDISYFESQEEGIPVNDISDADFAFFIDIENYNCYYKVYIDKIDEFRRHYTVINRSIPKEKEEYSSEYTDLHYNFILQKTKEYLKSETYQRKLIE